MKVSENLVLPISTIGSGTKPVVMPAHTAHRQTLPIALGALVTADRARVWDEVFGLEVT
jgi:hypothetical protein